MAEFSVALLVTSAFSDERGMKYVVLRFVWRQHLLEQETKETMGEIGVTST